MTSCHSRASNCGISSIFLLLLVSFFSRSVGAAPSTSCAALYQKEFLESAPRDPKKWGAFLSIHFPEPAFNANRFFTHINEYAVSSFREGANYALEIAKQTGHFRPKQLAPKAPEVALYNWQSFARNLENAKEGIPVESLQNLTRFDHRDHMGLYVASDPYSYGANYEMLMEVVLYRYAFPIQRPDGNVGWVRIESSHFRTDLSASNDLSNGTFSKGTDSVYRTRQFLVSDPRVIKELRLPPKEVILAAWKAARFQNLEDLSWAEIALNRAGIQWLLTPNYTHKERSEIASANWRKFYDYLRSESDIRILPNVTVKNPAADAVAVNSALGILLESQSQFVRSESFVLNYPEIIKAYEEASSQSKRRVRAFANSCEDSVLGNALLIAIAVTEGNIKTKRSRIDTAAVRLNDSLGRVGDLQMTGNKNHRIALLEQLELLRGL